MGRDIRHFEVANVAQCQDACNHDCRCKSIIFGGRICWLKWHECVEEELIYAANTQYYMRKGEFTWMYC